MVADTNTTSDAVAEQTKANADTAAEATKTTARAAERVATTARKTATKTVRKTAAARKSTTKPRRKAKAARAKAQPVRNERIDQMTKFQPTNMFAGFSAFPATSAFEKMFVEAASRGEEAVKRSRKAAEEFADLYRGNVEAFAEAGRIAATGVQSIGQDVVAKSRDSMEQTANTVRSFAEVKSPTELLQLQGEFARTAFDRFVEDSSALTESVVKLAGEAIQPLSNRASATAERFNDIAA